MRPVQYFTKEYLEHCRAMKPAQIVRFLDGFRKLRPGAPRSKSRLISMKIPEGLLKSFRTRCLREGKPYQTQIKSLMQDWLIAK